MATVLVVEDNPSNFKLALFLLESVGHSVLHAGDAQSGIALVTRHLPDLILMDVQLPGMDGLAATRIIKANADLKHIPIVALTALAMRGDEQRIMSAGCDAYISKPINYRHFLVVVENALQSLKCI